MHETLMEADIYREVMGEWGQGASDGDGHAGGVVQGQTGRSEEDIGWDTYTKGKCARCQRDAGPEGGSSKGSAWFRRRPFKRVLKAQGQFG